MHLGQVFANLTQVPRLPEAGAQSPLRSAPPPQRATASGRQGTFFSSSFLNNYLCKDGTEDKQENSLIIH
jgi:hypothetical protein